VYKGSGKRTPAIDRAVEETRGEMLFSGGDLVPAFYHSDSGGMTEANQNAWPEQKPEPTLVCAPDLPGVPPGFEHGVPPDRVAEWLANPPRAFQSAVDWARGTFRWTRDVPRRDLEARLPAVARSPKGGRLDKLEVTRRGCSGRALAMTFTVNGKPFEVQGELVLRRLLGGDKALKSSLIVIDDRGDTLHVTGGGFGHGVGMSQMGAIGRAQAGQTYREILRAYYTGAGIEKIY
jgi:SpoIID/LytB domain protein